MGTDLLTLAMNDPARAHPLIASVLESETDDSALARAHQARAVLLREDGSVEDALAALRLAIAHARRTDDADLVADVQGTNGVTLVLAGRTAAGLRQLERAVELARGRTRATVLMRLGSLLLSVGRVPAAVGHLERATDTLRSLDDPEWLGRTLNHLGAAYLTVGQLDRADLAFAEALRLEADPETLDGAYLRMNAAHAAFLRGDLPRALALYAEIDDTLVATGRAVEGFTALRARVYLAAGMPTEALAILESVPESRIPALERADHAMSVALAALAAGDHDVARGAAARAATAFARQRRGTDHLRARFVLVSAATRLGGSAPAAEASRVARGLAAAGADEAPEALVLAGNLGRRETTALYAVAAGYRTHASALVRASGWLGRALECEAGGDLGGALRACGRGLAAVDEHRRLLGSSELRAMATVHGRDLARIALRHAARDPRVLLGWSERWRATALAQPPVTPTGEVSPALAMLRDNGRRLAEARSEGEPTEDLERERIRLERQVRAEHHQRVGTGDRTARLDVSGLVDTVGDAAFVELVDVDGILHVLVVSRGRVRRFVAGRATEAAELAGHGRGALRRAAHGRPFDPDDLGRRLQAVILGEAAGRLPEGPVVIAPTARLHGAPWALLPALVDRPFSLVPSAAQWLRAGDVRRPRGNRLTLVAGPGLGTGGAEVPALAGRRPDAVHLTGAHASVERVLAAMDGATLAHVAAHGHFRADSPLFSSLELADGPLTVHELEHLRRSPYRLVLSACESGVLAPVGAEELLGLAAALFAQGSAGLVCSIAEVNDAATAALMVDLHDDLTDGHDPATALARARGSADDPVAAATAGSFVALGV